MLKPCVRSLPSSSGLSSVTPGCSRARSSTLRPFSGRLTMGRLVTDCPKSDSQSPPWLRPPLLLPFGCGADRQMQVHARLVVNLQRHGMHSLWRTQDAQRRRCRFRSAGPKPGSFLPSLFLPCRDRGGHIGHGDFTLGTAAPCGSVTCPRMEAVADCAPVDPHNIAIHRKAETTVVTVRMVHPFDQPVIIELELRSARPVLARNDNRQQIR